MKGDSKKSQAASKSKFGTKFGSESAHGHLLQRGKGCTDGYGGTRVFVPGCCRRTPVQEFQASCWVEFPSERQPEKRVLNQILPFVQDDKSTLKINSQYCCHSQQPAPPATGLRRWGEEAKDLPLLSPLSPAFLKNNICHSERSEEPASKSSSGSHCRCMQLPSQSAESKRAAHPPLPENNPHGQQTVRTNPTSQRRDRKTKKPGRSQTRARRPVPRAAHRGIRHKSRAQVAHSAPPGGKKRRTKRIKTTPNTASSTPTTHSPSII